MAKMISTFSRSRTSEQEMSQAQIQLYSHLQIGDKMELKNSCFTKLENGDVLHEFTSSPLYSE